jgi:hypothetical protein
MRLALVMAVAATMAACRNADEVTTPDRNAQADNSVVAIAPQSANLGTSSVTGAVPSPAGLRACWAGENNALDVVAGNLGATSGGGYTGGKFGQAFNFLALGDGIDIANSPSINFGASGTGVTMAAWIYGRGNMFQSGSGVIGFGPIIEYDVGAHLWQHSQQNGTENLFANLAEGPAQEQWHIVIAPNSVGANAWHHTAVTYSKATGVITLFVDGAPRASATHGFFIPNTTTMLHIGRRAAAIIGDPSFTFNGAIDEVQLYDRGLTASEVFQLASASGTMCVPPPASYQVSVMPVGSGESGVPFTTQPQVVILDANNNVVSNATTAVTATVTSGSGTLLGTTTVNAVNGVATFTNLAIAGAGNTTIGFTTTSLPAEPGSPTQSSALATVQVARQLGIATQPGGAVSGAPLAPQPVVEVRDAAGLRVPGTTNSIAVTLGSGPGALSGANTVVANNGTAVFSGLTITGAGTHTLTFSSSGLTSVSSSPVSIAGATPASISLRTAPPANGESGMVFATQPVVEIIDGTGNLATAASGSVTVALLGATGTHSLGGTTTVPVVNGVATFTNLKINGFGAFSLRFSYAALTPVSSSISVVQRVRQLAVIGGPPVVTSSLVMTPAWLLEVRDGAGLRVATATHLISVNISHGPGVTLTAGQLQRNAVAGIATFPDLVATGAGSFDLQWWIIEPGQDYLVAYAKSPVISLQAYVEPPPPPPPPTFTWGGFYAPINNLPTINKSEGGSTIPVKFSLGGNEGMNIFAAGYPASQQASCTTWLPTGPSSQISVPAGAGGITGDANILAALSYSDNKYQINWKTDKAWDGTCRILTVKLKDGTTRTANFQIK